jgi:hypothetical protein
MRLLSALLLFFFLTASAVAEPAIDFVNHFNEQLKALIINATAASIVSTAKMSVGDCSPPEETVYADRIKAIEQFERNASRQAAAQFSNTIHAASINRALSVGHLAWLRLLSSNKIDQAEAALHKECIDTASRLFREVVSLDASRSDVTRAIIGIDDIREKRARRQAPTSFEDRWAPAR